MLDVCRNGALALFDDLRKDERFVPAFAPELDIVVWAMKTPTVADASEAARARFAECARKGLHLALAELPEKYFGSTIDTSVRDSKITCLRSVVMKPDGRPSGDFLLGRSR